MTDVHTAPSPRNWRHLEKPSADGYAFTLISYNVLSPNYATPTQYPYCPTYAMDWEYRRRSILDELRNYNASIICLQELDTNQFDDVFKPQLAQADYDGVFIAKSRSRTMDASDCKKVDGCAIFWKRDSMHDSANPVSSFCSFEKICEFQHEFMLSCSNVSETPAPLLLNRVMTRDNVALGVVFETKGSNPRQFCVTTGHIHWDPEHSDVKVIQSIMWTAELWAYLDAFFAQNLGSKENRGTTRLAHDISSPSNPLVTGKPMDNSPAARMPVIMCGDFNSLPNSGVVEFLLNGRLNKKHAEFLDYGFKYMFEDWKMLEKWAVDGDVVRHRFQFDRAHHEGQGVTFTNYTYDFKGMIDYVFFTRKHLRLLGSLDQVPESWFAENRVMGCPHVHMASDHFPLLVELELLAETTDTATPEELKKGSSAPNSNNKQVANKRSANGTSESASATPASSFSPGPKAIGQRNANNNNGSGGGGKQMRYNEKK
ncbi:CCR4-NOT transcription complex subunit 6-like [Cichlidogyrus casuarinus]|uniref:CCR4-NOT transcription complex subunit 6-like n=1 Tax=Cichlidogyrus casuarinus TaxID=1844966 RepID=A0ABD2QL72_9PLAT